VGNCTCAQRAGGIVFLALPNCTAVPLAVRFGNTKNPCFIAVCAPVHFASTHRNKIALEGVLELATLVTTDAAVFRSNVTRPDAQRLEQSGQAVLGQRLARPTELGPRAA
jgi:hypothetical protein